jgi:hypothetical protein
MGLDLAAVVSQKETKATKSSGALPLFSLLPSVGIPVPERSELSTASLRPDWHSRKVAVSGADRVERGQKWNGRQQRQALRVRDLGNKETTS